MYPARDEPSNMPYVPTESDPQFVVHFAVAVPALTVMLEILKLRSPSFVQEVEELK